MQATQDAEITLKYLLPQKTRKAQRKALLWFSILRILASFAAAKNIFFCASAR
jgi:hypothetical protein